MLGKENTKRIYHTSNLASRITSSAILAEAYELVSGARKENHHNGDIWYVRANEYKEKISTQFLSGTYRLDPVNIYAISIVIDKEVIEKTGEVYHKKGVII